MTAPTRTSNKQILDAITDLASAIRDNMAAQAAPVVAPVATAPTATLNTAKQEGAVKVDAAYLSHVSGGKALDYANKLGEQVVIYARRNKLGETKLAYCAASKWTGLKDNANLGAVQIVEPTS